MAASLGIVLTLLYVAGLAERRNITLGRMGLESWAVIVTYLGGVAVLFPFADPKLSRLLWKQARKLVTT